VLTSVGFERFNPHPASLPGDAGPQAEPRAVGYVSIRTRHRCRVMHFRAWRTISGSSFQSAPGIAAG